MQIDGKVVWGKAVHGGVYIWDELNSRWEKLTDLECEATLTVCGGMLASVGGYKDGVFSRKVMLWREGKWTIMTEMLVGCMWSCVISLSEGRLIVMGGKVCECLAGSNNVQVFDGTTKSWHFGPPLPHSWSTVSAVVHEDHVILAGGYEMEKEVWSAKISDLVSHYALPLILCKSNSHEDQPGLIIYSSMLGIKIHRYKIKPPFCMHHI